MRRALKWLGIALCTLVVLLVVGAGTIYVFDQNLIRGVVSKQATRAAGRTFAVDGNFRLRLQGWTAHIRAEGVRLANPDWAKEPNMVQLAALDFTIDLRELLRGRVVLPELTLDQPKIDLEKPGKDRKNWDLSSTSSGGAVVNTSVPKTRTQVPVIGQLIVNRGMLKYEDAPSRLSVTSEITTAVGTGGTDREQMIHLQSKGTVQGRSFTLNAEGGSLLTLRDPHTRYPLNVELTAGPTVFSAKGTLTDPIQMEGLDMQLEVRGDNLADIFPFTAIPLPPTPVYRIAGHLTKGGDVWTFENFSGGVGHSDLEGGLRYDSSRERPMIQADLTSRLLDFADLAGFIGAGPAKSDAPKGQQSDRVIPSVPINIARLRAADLDVRLKAEQIHPPAGLPIQDMDARFRLRDGDLQIDPLKFGVADGAINGTLDLDGREKVPKVAADLSLAELSLKRFFSNTRFESLSAGRFGGHVQLTGTGASLAQVLGASDGRLTMSMAGGQVSALMIHAANLDVAKAIVNLLGTDKPTALRCVVGDFNVKRGELSSNIFVIDTELSNITGTMNVNLGTEALNVRVEGHPKRPSPFVARTPIVITGTLKSPKVGIDPTEIGARGAAAAALGVLLPPLAIIPFIETGVGKDSDCAELIRQAESQDPQQAAAPGKDKGSQKDKDKSSDKAKKPPVTYDNGASAPQ